MKCKQCGTEQTDEIPICLECGQEMSNPKRPSDNESPRNLKYCKDCGSLVSRSAKRCPLCGAKLQISWFAKLILGFLALSVVGVIVSQFQDKLAYDYIFSQAQRIGFIETVKYSKSLEGKTINWIGKIAGIKAGKAGTTVTIDVGEPGRRGLVLEVSRDVATTLDIGSTRSFSGRIKNVGYLFGMAIITLDQVSFK